jgi:DNA polymerase-3 subunit delta
MPSYLIHGPELIVAEEAIMHIRSQYQERDVFNIDNHFDWKAWWNITLSPSLLSNQRLIELHFQTTKFSSEIQDYLARWIEFDASSPDSLLVYIPDSLDRSSQQASWYKSWAQHAHITQAKILQGASFTAWLQKYCNHLNLAYTQDALNYLQQCFEGSPIGAKQALDVLALAYPQEIIGVEHIKNISEYSARYELFKLTEAWQMRDVQRVHNILDYVQKEEGISGIPLLVWMTAKSLRTLILLRNAMKSNQFDWGSAVKTYQLWGDQQSSVKYALSWLPSSKIVHALIRCACVDRMIKGVEKGDAWQELRDMFIELIGLS